MVGKLTLIAGLLAGSVVASASVGAQAAQTSKPVCVDKADSARGSDFVVLLRLRTDLYLRWKETGKWPDDSAANKALDAHSAYWSRQLRAGHALLAGGMGGDYWDNVAIIVVQVPTLADAQRLVDNDPAVIAHAFQAQVRPFDVFWMTNKFMPGAKVCPEVPTGTQ
jgi:uncharacterized protein YciI